MTDEYTARERALTLAHADSRDIILPAEDVIELAEKYLAFLMPATAGVEARGVDRKSRTAADDALWKATHTCLQNINPQDVAEYFRPQLHNGGIAG